MRGRAVRRDHSAGKGREVRRRPSRTVFLLAALCLALTAVAAVTAATRSTGHRTDRVASVDGHPVTRAELLFHMRRLAPAVQNELRTTYHLQTAPAWSAEVGGRTALQRLASRALEEIRRDKTTLILAREQGLTDSVDYADFTAALARENASRAAAVAAGRTVYGVTRFSADTYYTHRLTELTTGLEKRLSTGPDAPLHVTDAEVRRAFDADRGSWSAGATTYRYTRLVVPVPDGAPADFAQRLQRRVTAAGHLKDIAGEPGAELTTGTYEGTGGGNAHDQELTAVLAPLAPGRISAPVGEGDRITYYALDGKRTDPDRAFAAYGSRIRQSLVEKRFTEFLQRRTDRSRIEVDTAAVDAVNAEDVQR